MKRYRMRKYARRFCKSVHWGVWDTGRKCSGNTPLAWMVSWKRVVLEIKT